MMPRTGKVTNMFGTKCLFVLILVLLLGISSAVSGESDPAVQHFRIISGIEYSGQTQYCNQVGMSFAIKSEELSDGKVLYSIWPEGTSQDVSRWISGASAGSNYQFVLDKKTGMMSESGTEIGFLKDVHNECISAVKKLTSDKRESNWEQVFNTPLYARGLSDQIKFQVSTMELETKLFGKMTAVRAVSRPFVINSSDKDESKILCNVASVYVFDSAIEKVYLCISAFEASTKINGKKETLRHEVAAYRTYPTGRSIDMTGLGEQFGKFVREVGLSAEALEIKNPGALATWAKSEALYAGRASSLAAAIACEGASNPVSIVWLPAAETLELQSSGVIGSIGSGSSISKVLSSNLQGMSTVKIAAAPAFMGIGWGPAAAVAGGTGGAVAIGGGGSSSSSRSPSSP